MQRRAGGRGRGGGRERGAALILTLLVLAIMVVLVVQFAFSVKVEENIVQNTQDDSALELAARGAIPWITALLKDDRASGAPAGAVDALGDVLFDPNIPEARELAVGEVTLTIEAEDLDRRLPLVWLADEGRKEWAQKVLKYLLAHLQARVSTPEGDPEALAQAITDRVTEIVGASSGASLPGAGGGGGDSASSFPATRALLSIEQLLSEPAAEGDGGAAPGSGGGPGGAPAGGGGVSRRVLFGDPEADPPEPGLASYVTTWPLSAINLNTALPEVLYALIPDTDKAKEPVNLREEALLAELVTAIRRKRIDPAFQDPEGGGESTGDQGASKRWPGQAFTQVTELQSAEIHEKLAHIFTGPQAQGGQPQPGGGEQPAPGGGEGGEAGQAGEEAPFELKDALDVRSRFYAVKVTASLSPEVQAVFRLVLHRNDADEVRVLLFEEVGS